MKVDSDQRMMFDLDVICWSTEHFNYSLIIAIPSIIIWGLGIPIFAWIILANNKNDLDDLKCREKYGFLYNGFKKKYYYWESVNMFRKIVIIFIAAFLDEFGVITQALVVFLVLVTFLYLNVKIQPFAFPVLNDMEVFSLFTSMLTVY